MKNNERQIELLSFIIRANKIGQYPTTIDINRLFPSVTVRTILRDFQEIEEKFSVKVLKKDGNRNLGWFADFSDSKSDIRRDIEYGVLLNNSLSNFISDEAMEKHIDLDGRRAHDMFFVSDVLFAIKRSRIIKVRHREYFDSESTTFNVCPFKLKRYLNRWYILGRRVDEILIGNEPVDRISIDRISSLEVLKSTFTMPNIDIRLKEYNEIIGVSLEPDVDLVEVRLKFLHFQFKYYEADPWYSDYIIESATDGYETVIISFKVRPNNELYQRIINFNNKVVVLKPDMLIIKIQDILRSTLKNYTN